LTGYTHLLEDTVMEKIEHAAAERQRRLQFWSEVQALGDQDVEPEWLRERGLYGGAQGIWVNKAATGPISPDGSGVTVSFLHTGRHYADELSDDGVIYHYPFTNRPPSRDAGEVLATKNAGALEIPLFVILPGKRARGRRVKLGWVVDFDDATRTFLILFGPVPATAMAATSEKPFQLFSDDGRKKALTTVRPNQQRFRFDVLKRYGSQCAVCPIREPRLLKAAHICGKSNKGGDDWRNGLPLCSTHHDAFDAHFFAVEPKTLMIHLAPGLAGPAIGITNGQLRALKAVPHSEALEWRWADTLRSWG
jgi:hypothetical protein